MTLPWRGHWPLGLLLLLFVLLAIFYNVANPIFESPDELWHFRYVRHLANGEGLPVLQQDLRQNAAGQEGGQPPLYYMLAAATTLWVDTSDIESVSVASAYRRGLGPGPNVVVHTAREDLPYQGTTLAVHLARFVSTVIAAGTVLLVYLLGIEVSRRRSLALGAAFLMAFIPQFVFISASVNNDNLITMLSAAVLLLSVRLVRRGLGKMEMACLALALAAAPISKVSGLALGGLVLMAFALRARSARSLTPLRVLLPMAALMAAASGWWFVRNWALYGEALGMARFIEASGGASPALSLERAWVEIQRVWISTWALFGWSNVPADLPLYLFYGAVCFLGMAGLSRLAAVRGPGYEACGYPLLLMGSWVGILVILLLQYMRMVGGMQGRMLFPALPAVAVLLAMGLAEITPPRARRTLPAALGIIFFLPAALSPVLYIMPSYPPPQLLGAREIAAIPNRIDVTYGGVIRLLGYQVGSPSVVPGKPLGITLYWEALAPVPADYTVFLHAKDPRGNQVGAADNLLLQHYPSRAWRTGDALQESYTIEINDVEQTPSSVKIEAGLYEFPSMERLSAFDSAGRPAGTAVTIARLKAAGTGVQPAVSGPRAALGDSFRLAGYRRETEALRPGAEVRGAIWWEAVARPKQDYTVFVHLVGPNGLVAQYDAQPRGDSYPTSFWEAGEIVEDHFGLSIPEGAPDGQYRLVAGMYSASTGQRLGVGAEDYVLLDQFTLTGRLATQ